MPDADSTAPAPAPKPDPWWLRLTNRFYAEIMGPVLRGFETFGEMVLLLGQTLIWLTRRPFRWREYVSALDFVGVQSLSIILLVGVFTGAAFSLQTVSVFRFFGMEAYIGSTVTLALCRELSPVLTAIMITARAGSAMATELGSMRITEQIDAMTTLAVSPVQYLVCPRVVASVIVTPMLTMVFTVSGFVGAYIVAVVLMQVDYGYFVSNTEWMVDAWDITQGLIKASIFGLTLSVISCEQGFHAKGGAKGVGLATTRAEVYSCVTILMLDYFVSDILFAIHGYE